MLWNSNDALKPTFMDHFRALELWAQQGAGPVTTPGVKSSKLLAGRHSAVSTLTAKQSTHDKRAI